MAKEVSQDNSFGIASVVFGILSIIFSLNIVALFSTQVCGLILAVVAFVFSRKQKKKADNKWARAGFILSIIGALLNIVIFIWAYRQLMEALVQFQAQMQQVQAQMQASGGLSNLPAA